MRKSTLSISLVLFSILTTAQPIKAISFNIRLATESDKNNRWELRKASVIDFLAYEEADFIGMQEVLLEQKNDLHKGLENYKAIGVARDDGREKGEFSPIFYDYTKWKLIDSNTFWLSETPDIPGKSWDAALPRICTWGKFRSALDNDEIFVFNTHYDHVGREARRNSSQLIVDQIEDLTSFQNLILLGDFNATASSPPIQVLTESPLEDAFEESEITFGEVGTFNAFDHTKTPSRRIDYVFTDNNLEVVRYTVASHIIDGRFLSDHFPVIVQIEMK